MAVYLGTIALEAHRWDADQTATIDVPAYIERAVRDGFDGVELWGPHYLLADEAQRSRIEAAGHIAIFNTYLTFDKGVTDAMRETAEIINRLHPKAIKFNLGNKNERELQVETLKAFAAMLLPDIRLLCECHLYTLMDDAAIAAEIFHELGDHYGAMVHTRTGALSEADDFAQLTRNVEAYGDAICHIHASNFNGNAFVPIDAGGVVEKHLRYLLSNGFHGNCTVEFTVGTNAEEWYQNACSDLRWLNRIGIR